MDRQTDTQTDRRTDTQTHRQTQTDFIICPMLYAIMYQMNGEFQIDRAAVWKEWEQKIRLLSGLIGG